MKSPTSTMVSPYDGPQYSTIRRRIHGWSWQSFPIGMGTGAVYVLLSALNPHPTWVTYIEITFYILNMCLFSLNILMLSLQFILFRRQFLRLSSDPVKGVFVPLSVLSFATIFIGTINYAVPVGIINADGVYVMFWVYVVLAVIVSFPMLMVWFNQPHDVATFTPAWAFLIFPLMLTGIIALNALRVIQTSDPRALGILLIGYIFQGIVNPFLSCAVAGLLIGDNNLGVGLFMTFFYLAIYVLRIMTTGFMSGHQANGAFVASGPPGFTALALINLGRSAKEILPRYNLVSPMAGEIFYAASVMSALLLFGLAVFFFAFGALPYWFKLHKSLHEILGCWALTFPNVGWINTLMVLGKIFGISGFDEWHLVMTVLVCATWIVLFSFTVVAFWKGEIFMSRNEDIHADISFTKPKNEEMA
ncbi:Voltage-dependent anion channel [Rhizoctonia solani]|uniref:Voltage-dependent anion channel n=1 Tax=Rhizoctonia solani TaxID=456999 RepID=A0A8H7H493_9AGAM|nr:Voltage-dependent anion channel [Rhizoctonia solani]